MSVVLHAAIVALALRFSVLRPPPEIPVQAAPLIATVFLADRSTTDRAIAWPEPNMPGVDTIDLPVPDVSALDPVASDSFERSRAPGSLDDLAEVERLQGLYVRQIHARLARMLEMAAPVPVSPNTASCIVHVIQDERGVVLDVDMNDCRREVPDQERIAAAIRAASPLPAPPHGLAQGSYLTLDTTSL